MKLKNRYGFKPKKYGFKKRRCTIKTCDITEPEDELLIRSGDLRCRVDLPKCSDLDLSFKELDNYIGEITTTYVHYDYISYYFAPIK